AADGAPDLLAPQLAAVGGMERIEVGNALQQALDCQGIWLVSLGDIRRKITEAQDAASVICGDCMHLLRCQLPRDRAHLFADVVLSHALSEGQQLAFDISGALLLQRRSAEFVTARTVTGRARRDAACRIPGES